MRDSSSRLISEQQTAFLRFELENGDAKRRKVALQELSQWYRRGRKLSAEALQHVERTICGLVLQGQQDPKVVRWCLNALARIGKREISEAYVRAALTQFEGDAEIVASAVAALARMNGGKFDGFRETANVEPAVSVLASLQTVPPEKLDLSNFSIDIDNSSSDVLKLALITVGLNRDIKNLFHPTIENGDFVRALGSHDDSIVVQYSVWAVLENPLLTLDNLGVDRDHIDSLPPNVQSKILQIVAEREPDQRRRHSVIADAPFLHSAEAREGLAKGLSKVYYEGLEEVTLDWFDQEANAAVRELLAEHFARFSKNSSPYYSKSLHVLEEDPRLERRLLRGAEGHALYGEIQRKRMSLGTGSLFDDGNLDELSVRIRQQERKEKRLKVLMLQASPINEDRLRTDAEYRDIKEKMREITSPTIKVEIALETAVRRDRLQGAIHDLQPDVIHFCGHGDGGALCFEDIHGNAADVSAKAFADLMRLFKPTVKCVLLNACYSKSVADLVKAHVPFVVGCSDSIGDNAAIVFSRGFYQSLAAGSAFDMAFEFGKNNVMLEGMDSDAALYTLDRQS